MSDSLGLVGVRMHFAPGEEICAQDEDADYVYRLIDGAVRTTRLLSDGRRQVGEFYYPGDLFGLESGDRHRFSAEALGACEVLMVKRVSPSRTGADRDRFERAVWAGTTTELQRAQEHMMLLSRTTAIEKVASFLLHVVGRDRAETATLPMTRQDMGDYLGLTIETVSRMLGRLQADGIVEFAGCRHFRVRQHIALSRLAVA
ncbi:MAG: cyclic nucleotide-binding domain-containing protein [Brevundimonas sp.]|nr:MAG: cyclic nucleotide-binding domain-containing protein [Brevundimonas sp.]